MNRLTSAGHLIRRAMRSCRRWLAALLHHRILRTAIEFYLVDTCNLRCAQCAASSPFLTDANLPSLADFVESLGFLSSVLRCDEIRFVGGEPLLNKDICGFLRATRQSGIFGKILVITNGLLLPKMGEEFWQLADVVRLSVYPATADTFAEDKLESLRTMAGRHGTTLDVVRDTHFFTAISDKRIEDQSAVKRIFSTCGEAHDWSCSQLYRNRLYRCSRVPTLDRYLATIGTTHENFTDEDGIVIDGRASLFDDLNQYLTTPQPLKACSFCFGTSGPSVEHTQLTLSEIRAKRMDA